MGARIEQDGADLLADGCSARFPGDHDLTTFGAQRLGEALELGRLAAAVEAFEGDELAGTHLAIITNCLLQLCGAESPPRQAKPGAESAT